MNAFERHGIHHLSASSGNTFAAAPALWIAEKLLKRRAPVGPAAHRGSASEAGVSAGLFDPALPLEECGEIAQKKFDDLTALQASSTRQKERDAIPGIVTVALNELRQYGVPEPAPGDRQHKIQIELEDVPVPIIGYLDFLFPEHGICIDLKTQLRLASSINAGHARQGAIYKAGLGDNYDMRFAYVTPSKIGVYRLENYREHLEAMRRIFLAMERLLNVSSDPQEIAGLTVPDYSSFYWNTPQARQIGLEVYGF